MTKEHEFDEACERKETKIKRQNENMRKEKGRIEDRKDFGP